MTMVDFAIVSYRMLKTNCMKIDRFPYITSETLSADRGYKHVVLQYSVAITGYFQYDLGIKGVFGTCV